VQTPTGDRKPAFAVAIVEIGSTAMSYNL